MSRWGLRGKEEKFEAERKMKGGERKETLSTFFGVSSTSPALKNSPLPNEVRARRRRPRSRSSNRSAAQPVLLLLLLPPHCPLWWIELESVDQPKSTFSSPEQQNSVKCSFFWSEASTAERPKKPPRLKTFSSGNPERAVGRVETESVVERSGGKKAM